MNIDIFETIYHFLDISLSLLLASCWSVRFAVFFFYFNFALLSVRPDLPTVLYPFSLPVMFELLNLSVFSDFYSFAATQPQFTDVCLCFCKKHKHVEFILASKLYQANSKARWKRLKSRQVAKKSCKSKPQKYKIPKIRPATEKVKVMFKVEVIKAKSNTKQQSRQGQVSKKSIQENSKRTWSQ